jgi:hypothetical protein
LVIELIGGHLLRWIVVLLLHKALIDHLRFQRLDITKNFALRRDRHIRIVIPCAMRNRFVGQRNCLVVRPVATLGVCALVIGVVGSVKTQIRLRFSSILI